jgi:hypothetical protein
VLEVKEAVHLMPANSNPDPDPRRNAAQGVCDFALIFRSLCVHLPQKQRSVHPGISATHQLIVGHFLGWYPVAMAATNCSTDSRPTCNAGV